MLDKTSTEDMELTSHKQHFRFPADRLQSISLLIPSFPQITAYLGLLIIILVIDGVNGLLHLSQHQIAVAVVCLNSVSGCIKSSREHRAYVKLPLKFPIAS